MSTYTDPFGKERSSSITEYTPNEINRTTREKNIKTLQDIRKDHLRPNNLAADNVKDFLQDTNASFSTDGGKLTNDPQVLEKRIIKQQYLINNKLFDPTEYFGGLDISNLDEHTADQRLEDMFQYYLPTEDEEREGTIRQAMKPTQAEKTQNKPVTAPKQIEISKSNWDTNSKDKSYAKAEVYASITKEFPETTKAGKEPIEFEPLSPLSASHLKLHPNFKKEFGQSLISKPKNPLKPKVIAQTANVVQEYKPVIAHKKKKSAGLSDKENKAEDRDIAHLRSKKSASVSKKPGSIEPKANCRAISDINANSFIPKSANTSLSRNNRSTVQDGNQNYSLNTTAKANLSQQHNRLEIDRKPAASDKIITKEDTNQRVGSTKTESQSTGRSKTKSTDQVQASQNLRRCRKTRKNFSSFNSALTAEDEPEFLFKSFTGNTFTRPQTSHTVAIDDNNYVLKGILSPTITKNLVSKGINKGAKNNQKANDKPQPVNPLKFLNDLLSKRKISSGSSDHLRMPKKPTFLENKVGSPGSQLGPKHAKTPSKSDLFETRITNHVSKKAQGVNVGNYASANFKSLFTLKNFEK